MTTHRDLAESLYAERDALRAEVERLRAFALDGEKDRKLGEAVREAFSFSGSAPFEFGKVVDVCRGVIAGPLWEAVCDVRDAIDASTLHAEEADR